jgi:broad specificity phosphatase PhoE
MKLYHLPLLLFSTSLLANCGGNTPGSDISPQPTAPRLEAVASLSTPSGPDSSSSRTGATTSSSRSYSSSSSSSYFSPSLTGGESSRPKTFTFLRHGSTDFSWRLLHNGPQDLGLNKSGKKHITSLARKAVAQENMPVAIVTSDLVRCVETAELFKKEALRATFAMDFLKRMNMCMLGMDIPMSQDESPSEVYRGRSLQVSRIPITKDRRLREIYHGDWSMDPALRGRVKGVVDEYDEKIRNGQIDEHTGRNAVLSKMHSLGRPSDAETWEGFVGRAKGLDKVLDSLPSGTWIVSHGMVMKEYMKHGFGKEKFAKYIEPKWKGEARPLIRACYYNHQIVKAKVVD